MSKINYSLGDATKPIIKDGLRIIPHICNDIGKWGKGFVLALSRKWDEPEKEYINWYRTNTKTFKLGEIQVVDVGNNINVVNLIGQHDIRKINNVKPIRYEAVENGLNKLINYLSKLEEKNITIHMPRIGAGLAGGEWNIIEKIINETLIKNGYEVFVYDLKS